MRQCGCLIVVQIAVLIVGCRGTKNAGTGDASRVNLAEAAKSPDAKTLPANHEVLDPGTESDVPSRPTTGTRKQATSAPVAAPRILPCDVAIFPCPFDGVAQGNFGSPPDPNSAVGAGDIVEVVNDQIQVTDRRGAVLCGGSITLQRLLRTSDNLTDPR